MSFSDIIFAFILSKFVETLNDFPLKSPLDRQINFLLEYLVLKWNNVIGLVLVEGDINFCRTEA